MSPDQRRLKQNEDETEYEQSPRTSKKKNTVRDSQRNYFRKDQSNKAMLSSLRKTASSRKSFGGSNEEMEAKLRHAEDQERDISQHDQTMGGQHEHHGSQHRDT